MGYYRGWYTALRGLHCITLLPQPISSPRCPKFKNWSPTPFLCILNASREGCRLPSSGRFAIQIGNSSGVCSAINTIFSFPFDRVDPCAEVHTLLPSGRSVRFFAKSEFAKKVLSRAPLRIDRLCFHNATSCLFKSVGAVPSPSKSAEKIPNPLNF